MPQPRKKKGKMAVKKGSSSVTVGVTTYVQKNGVWEAKEQPLGRTDVDPPRFSFSAADGSIPQAGPSRSSDKQNTSKEQTLVNPGDPGSPEFDEWLPYMDEMLFELLLLDIPPPVIPCTVCESPKVYRCLSCSGNMSCKNGLVSRHARDPLHKVQVWSGSSFDDVSLAALGLVIQLGHCDDGACSIPSAPQDLMVLDISGVRRIVVRYCGCDKTVSRSIQITRVGWYPTPSDNPTTAFTHGMLDYFSGPPDEDEDILRNFYDGIIAISDVPGLDPKNYPYEETVLVLRYWGDIKREVIAQRTSTSK